MRADEGLPPLRTKTRSPHQSAPLTASPIGRSGPRSFFPLGEDPLTIILPRTASTLIRCTTQRIAMGLATQCLMPIIFIAVVTQATAQDVYSAPRENAERLCDSFGPGFVPGHQPGSCVKVQQRLRVAPARNHHAPAPPPTAFAPMHDSPARPQLRLQGSFGVAGPDR